MIIDLFMLISLSCYHNEVKHRKILSSFKSTTRVVVLIRRDFFPKIKKIIIIIYVNKTELSLRSSTTSRDSSDLVFDID